MHPFACVTTSVYVCLAFSIIRTDFRFRTFKPVYIRLSPFAFVYVGLHLSKSVCLRLPPFTSVHVRLRRCTTVYPRPFKSFYVRLRRFPLSCRSFGKSSCSWASSQDGGRSPEPSPAPRVFLRALWAMLLVPGRASSCSAPSCTLKGLPPPPPPTRVAFLCPLFRLYASGAIII